MASPLDDWRRYISEYHGRNRGWCKHHLSSVLYRLGVFRPYACIEWRRVDRLVFVCKGNICRSPYAEVRARSRGLEATSFGLSAEPTVPPNPTAASVASEFGVDLTPHRARSAQDVQIRTHDLLVAMEPWQARTLLPGARRGGAQVTLLGLWSSPRRLHLEDPYGRLPAYFRICFSVIDSAISRMLSFLETARRSG